MIDYYAKRAAEYEKIYKKPERQAALARMKETLAAAFEGLDVLEVACGTGYWTQVIAHSARRILATDAAPETLAIARRKDYGACRVAFAEADAYSLADVAGDFAGGFMGFWWSHVPRERLAGFLSTFHSKLREGAVVVAIDNVYVEGSSTPVSRTDEGGNTFQLRRLEDGSAHEVLKNFPDEAELRRVLASHASDLTIVRLPYYWLARYHVSRSGHSRS